HLRLQRDAAALQAEDPGAGALRVDHAAIELLPGGEPRDWEDSYFNRIGPGRLPRGAAGAVLHGGRVGQPTGEGAEAVHAGPLPGAARPGAPADLRRAGLRDDEPRRGGAVVPRLRRPVSAPEHP